MKSPFILDEPAGPQATCLVGFADRNGAGRCTNPDCGRHSTALLNGYCITCTSKHGVNPMRAVCQPIRLTDDAAEAAESK
ncbi:MAG: hypothetical protein K2W95_32220 [Candidatus Obscuribacterales bacterium]|nr:hypothetical protein [Candidatus Obscuribacterales bacterium]